MHPPLNPMQEASRSSIKIGHVWANSTSRLYAQGNASAGRKWKAGYLHASRQDIDTISQIAVYSNSTKEQFLRNFKRSVYVEVFVPS